MSPAPTESAKWTMPRWMKRHAHLIGNTGGNPVAELMNDHTTTFEVNIVRAMLCVAVKSQVNLLMRLYAAGRLT